jgi:UDP-N-acetylmuramyl pentapeptide phosphotransferase/UDP-N-acetylglucosamine-1-phosphate transferase
MSVLTDIQLLKLTLAGGMAAILMTAGLILVLMPVLQRYALARPNARSSHTLPTPQGGGMAVVAATLLVVLALAGGLGLPLRPLLVLSCAACLLALVGAVDDIRPLSALLRLGLQALAVALVLAGPGMRLFPDLMPLWAERPLVLFAALWFVNLVNFMDGLDWMSVVEIVPLTGAAAIIGGLLGLPDVALVGAALAGAMLGFAPFNRPMARLFLGDVGSLPIGLLSGWLLYRLAGSGALAAATILPLYYIADATLTLMRRLAHGEKVWEAHRSHFYQRATDYGFSVRAVVGRVLVLNLVLGALAFQTLVWTSPVARLGLVIAAMVAVGLLLADFSRPRLNGTRA